MAWNMKTGELDSLVKSTKHRTMSMYFHYHDPVTGLGFVFYNFWLTLSELVRPLHSRLWTILEGALYSLLVSGLG